MRSKDAKKFKSKCSPSSSNSAIFAVMHPFRFLNPQRKALAYGFWILPLRRGRRDDWGPSHSFSLPQVVRKSCLGSFHQALEWGPGWAWQSRIKSPGCRGWSGGGAGQPGSSLLQPLPDSQEATPGSTGPMYPCRYPGCINGSTQLMCSGTSGVH